MSERIPLADIERARARLDVIASDVALKRKNDELVGLCPFHNEKTPSFFVVPAKEAFFCLGCGAHGNAIDYVMRRHGIDFREAVEQLVGLAPQRAKLAAPPTPLAMRPARENHLADVRAIVSASGPVVPGTAAYLYLMMRGLTPRQPGLLAHQELYCHETKRSMQAIVAPIRNSAGDITAVQRIYLKPSINLVNGVGPKDNRADLEVRKKTLGDMQDGAVRLHPATGPILGIAEGVETALAAAQLMRVPVWAACGATRLPSVFVPPGVQRLVIFADRGEAGIYNAKRAVEAFRGRGRQCSLQAPPAPFGDFNDQLLARR